MSCKYYEPGFYLHNKDIDNYHMKNCEESILNIYLRLEEGI